MTVPELQDLVDRFGADPRAWPRPARRRAKALLSHSSAARDVLTRAHELAELARGVRITAPPGLADRIVAKALTNGKLDPTQATKPAKTSRR